MANPNEFSQPVSFLNGGPFLTTWGPYLTKELACEALKNEVDADGRNMRSGKTVAIGTVTDYVEHAWIGDFKDSNLTEVSKPIMDVIDRQKANYTDVVKPGVNLFNIEWINTLNAQIHATTGSINTNAAWNTRVTNKRNFYKGDNTHLISSLAGTIWVGFWDIKDRFLGKFATNSTTPVLIPNTTAVWAVEHYGSALMQIQFGTQVKDFEPFKLFSNLTADSLSENVTSQLPELIPNSSIGREKTTFFKTVTGKNLFDKTMELLPNSRITNGNIETNASFTTYITQPIPIDSINPSIHLNYTLNSPYRFEDENHETIAYGGSNFYNSNPKPIPSSAKYIRFQLWSLTPLDTLQLEYGTMATTYEPYYSEVVFSEKIDKQLIIEALEGKDLLALSNEIAIPAKVHFLQGKENNIYFRTLSKKNLPNTTIGITGTGLMYKRTRSTITPATGGNISASVIMYDTDYNELQKKNVSLVVSSVVKNNAINYMKIGDSWTAPAHDIDTMLKTLSGVTACGTLRGHSQYPDDRMCEGRSGWTLANYFNVANTGPGAQFYFTPFLQPTGAYLYKGVTARWISGMSTTSATLYKKGTEMGINPATGILLNPSINDVMYFNSDLNYKYWDGTQWVVITQATLNFSFNFAKYRQAFNIPVINVLSFEMGINDFGGLSLSAIPAVYATFKTNLDTLIESVKLDNPSCKIGVHLPFNGFNNDFPNAINEKVDIKARRLWEVRKRLIASYDAREAESIYVVDTASSLDPNYAFIKTDNVPFEGYSTAWLGEVERVVTDPIHPSLYTQIGIRVAAFIQAVR